jgi:hypothetical protein
MQIYQKYKQGFMPVCAKFYRGLITLYVAGIGFYSDKAANLTQEVKI